jgi:DNA-binding beta-propeller fold protein YncE
MTPMIRKNPGIFIMQAPARRVIRFNITIRGLFRAGASLLAASLLVAAGASRARAQLVKASIPTAPGASAIAVNPVTNTVYVASNMNNVVTVINGSTLQTTTVNIGAGAVAIDIDTSTNKVFVANRTGSSVTEIDGATNAASTIALHGTPTSLAVDSATHKVWVPVDTFDGNYTYGAVELIDEATGTVTDLDKGIIPALQEIAINPVTDMIYVPNSIFSGMLTTTVFDGSDNSYSYVSDATGEIAIDTGTNQIFIANVQGGLIDIAGVTGFYSTIGGGGTAVAVNQATHTVFTYGGGLTIYDEASGASTVVSVPTSSLGATIVVDPTANKAFVSSFTSPGILAAVDVSTDAVTTVSVAPLVFATAINPNTGFIFLVSNDATGTVTVVDGRAGASGPIFAVQPMSQTVISGSLVALSATAGFGASPTFQWSFNGAPLTDTAGVSGSATSTLYLDSVSAASAGSYTCTISDAQGSTASDPAVLTVVSSTSPGHLINLSCRAFVGLDGFSVQDDLIAGFVIGGQGVKSVVLRGVGPGLGSFGIIGFAPSLSLALFDTAAVPDQITSDSAWQAPPTAPSGPWAGKVFPVDATASDFQEVGAFALAPGSADAALKIALPAGAYTTEITVPPGEPYVALAEVYDADPAGSPTVLTNLSARSYISSNGVAVMIAGFVISGSTSQTILIRASGPALTPFGVSNVLPQPQLTLYNSNNVAIASNAGWQGNPEIAQAASAVGAFAWTNPASADSALLATLPPGSYTAFVTGESGAGTALVEVYAVP